MEKSKKQVVGTFSFFIICLLLIVTARAQDRSENNSKYLAQSSVLTELNGEASLKKIISAKYSGEPLKSVLEDIGKKAGFQISYNNQFVPLDKPVTLNINNVTVNKALWKVLEGTGLRFKSLENDHLVLKKRQKRKRSKQAQEQISGTVTDASSSQPLPGVNIIVKGTSNGTSTGKDGMYDLNVQSLQDTLLFSFVGFQKKEVPINGRNEINVSLAPQAVQGEEMVVVGFGKQKRENVTGSVASVSSEKLESRPVNDTGQMLEGVVPGLNVSTSGLGGELDQEMSFNIRGTGTIGAGSNASPLVLVDGVEASLNSVNPDNIKSVTVLKDAAASAVYGSRAAFGVVKITTKNGQKGDPVFKYSNNFRFTSPLHLPDMMDSHTFALYWNEAAANSGQGAKFSDDVMDRIVQYQKGEIDKTTIPNDNGDRWQYYTGSNANVDWFDEQYKDFAFAQNHDMSISGGTESVTYYASGSFLDQGGLSEYAGDQLNRYRLNGKINVDITDKVLFKYSTRFMRQKYTRATHQTGLFYHNIARRWPTVPVKDPNGYYTDPSEINSLKQGGTTDEVNDKIFMQGSIEYDPLPNWNITGELNYRVINRNNHSEVLPAYANDVEGNRYGVGVAAGNWGSHPAGYSEASEYNRKGNYYTANLRSTYSHDFNNHHFKLLVGGNMEVERYRTLGGERTGLISPDVPTINTATQNSKATEGQYQHWATAGAFGRLNYNYDQRYFLEVNGRYDGSSRFIGDKRWNLFPSFSAGWDIAKESFWVFDETISQFKLRGSFGELGNQNTNNWYPFYSTMPVGVNNGNWLINGDQPNTASSPPLVSSQLTWERVRNWNVGVDMAMLNNRLSLSVEYFVRKTLDMVGPAPELPDILGTAVPRLNNADMKSTGFEIEAEWQDQVGDFNYSVRAVLSDDKQEILKYPNPTGDISTWYEGRKLGEIWGYKTKGLAHSDKEINQHLQDVDQSTMGSNWQSGDVMYKDINGDGQIDGGSGVLGDTGDQSVIGNSQPRYQFSLDFSGNYKNFDFRMFWQGVGKRDWMPSGSYFWGATGGMWQSAGFKSHMDYYRDKSSPMVKAGVADVNKDAYLPRPYFGTGKNQNTQTRWLQDASYVRLKNLQIGYTLENSVLSAIGASNLRVYVSGDNLLTFTALTDQFDPEELSLSGWDAGKTYPLARVYSIGLDLKF